MYVLALSDYKQTEVSDSVPLVKSETSVSKYSKQAASDARTRLLKKAPM